MMRNVLLSTALALLVAGGVEAARLVGTNGPDRLLGTPGADTLLGLGGNDRLYGLGGPDVLDGGPGRDLLAGGPGGDRIAAQYDGSRDVVRCGAGPDIVNADVGDAVAGDCELVGRRLSRDPYTNPEGQHETQVEPDGLTVGQTTVAAFQSGRRFDGAATNISWSTTRDGGRTWSSGHLPGLTTASRPAGTNARASDPVVGYDAATRTWLIASLALEGQTTRLTVSRSSDGVTWSAPVVAVESTAQGDIAFDKEWIACDNGQTSPFRGRCYLVYTDTQGRGALGIVTSTDGGLTWSQPARAPVADVVGVIPVVRPNGDLVVVYLWRGDRIGASLSRDGGVTFGQPALVSPVRARAARGLRFYTLPAADVDPSGRVWVTWHDCRFSPGCRANAVTLSSSTDGVSWTPPVAATRKRNAMLPTIGIHPTTGRIALAYHVVRVDGGVDVELVEARAGRPGWGAPRRLNARTMRPEWMPDTRLGRMLADYISVTYAGSRPLVVWVLASEPEGSRLRQAVYATRG